MTADVDPMMIMQKINGMSPLISKQVAMEGDKKKNVRIVIDEAK